MHPTKFSEENLKGQENLIGQAMKEKGISGIHPNFLLLQKLGRTSFLCLI